MFFQYYRLNLPACWRARPIVTSVSRISATSAGLARLNCPASSEGVAVPLWCNAASTACTRSAIFLGQAIFDLGFDRFWIWTFSRACQGEREINGQSNFRLAFGLIVRAQPVDDAAFFLGGALGVQGDEPFQNFRVGQGGGPAVGGEHGGVEVVVQLFQDGDEAGVVDDFFLVGEFFTGADFFEDVVKAGEREAVLGLDALAVRVQFLRQFTDGLFLRLAANWKRKRIEAN